MLTKNDIDNILQDNLSRVFYSEDDFQHALAWAIRQQHPDVEIRLERENLLTNRGKEYIDIVVIDGDTFVPFELKYKTARAVINIDGRQHELKKQGAHDAARKHFVNDLQRLEKFVSEHKGHGYALFLTNDSLYWKEPGQKDVLDLDFRLYEGWVFTDSLEWREERDWMSKPLLRPIDLKNEYKAEWKPYSYKPVPEDEENTTFKYLLLRVD